MYAINCKKRCIYAICLHLDAPIRGQKVPIFLHFRRKKSKKRDHRRHRFNADFMPSYAKKACKIPVHIPSIWTSIWTNLLCQYGQTYFVNMDKLGTRAKKMAGMFVGARLNHIQLYNRLCFFGCDCRSSIVLLLILHQTILH